MKNNYAKVMILILNWNGWRDTLESLDSVFQGTYPNYQVLLLDNNSENDSVARIIEWAEGKKEASGRASKNTLLARPLPYICYDRQTAEQGGLPSEEDRLSLDLPDGVSYPLVIIQTGGNLGFAGGNNVGIRFAQQRGADYVLLFNNDAVMSSPSGLITLVEFMDCHADVGACGARLLFPDGSPQSSYGRFPSILHTLAILFPLYKLFPDKLFRRFKRSNIIPDASVLEPIPIDYPSGACILVRNKAIEDVGLMDERYFMYAEETDWCYRMMKRGWGRYYVPQMEVLHKFGGSFGTATLKMRRFHLESLFKYFKKHFSEGSLLVLSVGYFLRSLYSIVCWKIIEKFLPKERSRSAIEQAQYWQLAYDQAVRTMKELFFGEASMQIKSKAKQQGIK